MPARHSSILPSLWLMTDERMGEALLRSIVALPKGSGVVFRHYGLALAERRSLFRRVRRIARARRLRLLLADQPQIAWAWGADGVHGRVAMAKRALPGQLKSAPVHNPRERIAAERAGADMIFASPVFATRSHPQARGLGPVQFGLMVRGCRIPIIALGGMTAKRAKALKAFGIVGWAAIDALTQSR
jgi:thiamine-phosphate pyrophosphorylase